MHPPDPAAPARAVTRIDFQTLPRGFRRHLAPPPPLDRTRSARGAMPWQPSFFLQVHLDSIAFRNTEPD